MLAAIEHMFGSVAVGWDRAGGARVLSPCCLVLLSGGVAGSICWTSGDGRESAESAEHQQQADDQDGGQRWPGTVLGFRQCHLIGGGRRIGPIRCVAARFDIDLSGFGGFVGFSKGQLIRSLAHVRSFISRGGGVVDRFINSGWVVRCGFVRSCCVAAGPDDGGRTLRSRGRCSTSAGNGGSRQLCRGGRRNRRGGRQGG